MPPSLADELLHSEDDEDTSGTDDTDPKQRQAALTISFRGRKVLLSVESVVAGEVREDGGGVAVDSPSIYRFIDNLINPSIHPLTHPSIFFDPPRPPLTLPTAIPPSLADELLHSEEDEDTSGTADN